MKTLQGIKVDKRINYKLVVDIETANFIEDALAYDIGFAVADKKGRIYYTDSLMIADMFIDNKELLTSAYYAKKIPNYFIRFFTHLKSPFLNFYNHYTIEFKSCQ
jgi:hypothetical protein